MPVDSGTMGVAYIGVNQVAAVTAWTLDQRALKIPAHTSGTGLSTDLVGRYSADGTLDCLLDDDDTTGQMAMVPGATVSLELFYTGIGIGEPRRVFPAIIETVSETMGVDAANARTFTFWTNARVTVDGAPGP